MSGKELITSLRSASSASFQNLLLRPYLNVFGQEVRERFVILGNARTGSNYLLDGLKSSTSIKMYHEIFASHNREIGRDFEQVLSTLFQKEAKGTRMVGFKLFYNHLTPEEWEKFLAHDEFRVIHLTRANRLRTIISLEIAFKTGQWTQSSRSREMRPEDRMVTLDPKKLLERLERLHADEQLARERVKARPVLEVVYETMTGQPLETFERIGSFLGVSDIDPM